MISLVILKEYQRYKNRYDFAHNTPPEFEVDNPNILLTVYDENDEIIYHTINNSKNKVKIVKINNHRYHTINPLQNIYIKLNKLLNTYSQEELSSLINLGWNLFFDITVNNLIALITYLDTTLFIHNRLHIFLFHLTVTISR